MVASVRLDWQFQLVVRLSAAGVCPNFILYISYKFKLTAMVFVKKGARINCSNFDTASVTLNMCCWLVW